MKDLKQELYNLLIKELKDFSDMEETSEEFINKLAQMHIIHLLKDNYISQTHTEDIKTDIITDLWDIFRKVTYGHSNLKSYREFLRKTEK